MKSLKLTLLLLTPFFGCVIQGFAATDPKASSPKPPCCREGLTPASIRTSRSYRLDATWTSDVGSEVKLEVLRGRLSVGAKDGCKPISC